MDHSEDENELLKVFAELKALQVRAACKASD